MLKTVVRNRYSNRRDMASFVLELLPKQPSVSTGNTSNWPSWYSLRRVSFLPGSPNATLVGRPPSVLRQSTTFLSDTGIAHRDAPTGRTSILSSKSHAMQRRHLGLRHPDEAGGIHGEPVG